MSSLEDDLLALERKVIEDGAGEWLRGIAALRVALAMDSPDIHEMVRALVLPRIDALAEKATDDAYQMSRAAALKIIQSV